MTTLILGTYRNVATNRSRSVSRVITRLRRACREAKHYDKGTLQHRSYIEHNLTDSHVGPEIARTLR